MGCWIGVMCVCVCVCERVGGAPPPGCTLPGRRVTPAPHNTMVALHIFRTPGTNRNRDTQTRALHTVHAVHQIVSTTTMSPARVRWPTCAEVRELQHPFRLLLHSGCGPVSGRCPPPPEERGVGPVCGHNRHVNMYRVPTQHRPSNTTHNTLNQQTANTTADFTIDPQHP